MTNSSSPSPELPEQNGKSKAQERPSKSYMKFEGVMNRALNLISLQESVGKFFSDAQITHDHELSDMTRAAIVLGVAAMDSYFTDVFAERLVSFLKKHGPTDAMTEILKEAGLDTTCALQMLAMERPYRRIRRLIENHLELKTTQKFATIDTLFLAYGIKDFSANVQKYKKRRNLIKSIEKLVKRRHIIAHQGDMNAKNKINTVDPARMKTRLMNVIAFVSGSDELLHHRTKKRGRKQWKQ